jgi:hypothetical protein
VVSQGSEPDPTVNTQDSVTQYEHALSALYDHTKHTARFNSPDYVQMSDAAQEAFRAELNRNRELAPACGAISDSLAGHVAKYGTLLARLVLVFHALEDPEEHPIDRPVSAATVQLATRYLRKCFMHARVFYRDLCGGDHAFDLAQRVGRYILANRMDEVTRAKLTSHQPAFRDARDPVRDAAMRLLEDFWWVTPEAGRYQKVHVTRWLVNPAVHVLFAEEGEAHRQERERVLTAIRESRSE